MLKNGYLALHTVWGALVVGAAYSAPTSGVLGYAIAAAITGIAFDALMLSMLAASRKRSDVFWMAQGVCPTCGRPQTMQEVTSTPEKRVVRCLACSARYDIHRSDNGPIVKRTDK